MATPTNFKKAYNSFSGADIRATILMPQATSNGEVRYIPKVLGTLQTISYSIFREKHPVRALGTVAERGKTRGTRTIAGSLVFTVFDRHSFFDLMTDGAGGGKATWRQALADQLPRFDIIITCANEYGHSAQTVLYGIELMSEGTVLSIENLITEATFQFTASNIAVMKPGELLMPKGDSDRQNHKTGHSTLIEYQKEKEAVYEKAINPWI